LLYGLGKYAPKTKLGNWSRAKIISNNMKTIQPQSSLAYYITGNSSPTTSHKMEIIGNSSKPSVKTAVTEPLDQIQTFKKRALLKTGKNIDDVPVFDLYTKEGRDAASKHLIKKYGLDPGETYDDAYNYYNKTLTDWANEDGFGPGMGWNEFGMAHVSKQLPEPMYSSAYVHEVGHVLHYPKNPIPKGVFKETIKNRVVNDKPYFIKNNNTEIAEAINQVLTYHGIDHGNPISGNQLKRMFERYIKNMEQDNTKSFIYKNVADWDGLAKWANDWENVIGLGTPITIGAVNYGNEN
jgi:hypothetical protein